MSKMILVTATRAGFFEYYRNPGDVFTVPQELFSKTWMEPGDNAPAKSKPDLKRAARAEALAAGGPSAALETALRDVADAQAREAEMAAKLAELEAKLAATSGEAAELEPAPEPEPDSADGADAGEPDAPPAPVQRVRRTR